MNGNVRASRRRLLPWLAMLCLSLWLSPAHAGEKEALRLLVIGDFYSKSPELPYRQSWPGLLHSLLLADGVTAELDILAKPGWTSAHALNSLKQDNLQTTYEWVIVMVGVHNQQQNRSINSYRRDMKKLLRRAAQLSDGRPQRVLVMSIPDWSATRDGKNQSVDISPAIDRYNSVLRIVSMETLTTFLDIGSSVELARNDFSSATVHPRHFSRKLYMLWAKHLRTIIRDEP